MIFINTFKGAFKLQKALSTTAVFHRQISAPHEEQAEFYV